MLIYRKKYNHIEHFEPHGQKFMAESIENEVSIQQSTNLLLKIFVESINEELLAHSHQSAKDITPLKLITSNVVCPYLRGFQAEEENIDLFKDDEKEGGGYCSAWSMFFTELCLKNPDLTSNEIITRVFRLYDSETIGQFLRNVIRGYALFIDEKINKYYAFLNDGKKLNIEKIKKMSSRNRITLYRKMKFIINIEMEMSHNPNILDGQLKALKRLIKDDEKHGRFLEGNDVDPDYKRLEYKTLLAYKRNMDKFDSVNSESDIQIVSNRSNESNRLIEKGCPPGKEINPVTKRCIKIKVKTPKQEKKILINELIHLPRECPPGKEWNPDTKRCRNIIIKKTKKVKEIKNPTPPPPQPQPENLLIKPCPPGKEWNPDTKRCRKITVKKTKKVKEVVQIHPVDINLPTKSCPPGKEINPKTNRCIKIKTKN